MCWGTISGREAMHIDDFDFDLPRELIALHPCEPRDAARLMVIPASGGFEDRRISDLPALLHPGDLLVFNDTKVIPARLTGRRGAAVVEVTLHRDLGGGSWRAFAKGARRLRVGDRLVFAEDFFGVVGEKHPEGDVTLRFELDAAAFWETLARHGSLALPPHHQAPTRRRSARPTGLSDDLRPRRGGRCGADRRTSLHPLPPRGARP